MTRACWWCSCVTRGRSTHGVPATISPSRAVGRGSWPSRHDGRDLVVDTRSCDGFFGDHLDFELRARGRDHLLACGFAGEVLVDGTVRSANDRGYECLALRDAIVPFDPDTGERVLASVTMSGGIFGAVGSSDAVLTALGCPIGSEADAPTQEVVT